MPRIHLNTLLACGVALAAAPAVADEASDFYAGRNVTIVIGYGAGGGADTYGRFLAQHLGEFIPGKPNVIVQNMPGAGGLKATNYVYAAAPKDGAVLTMVQPYLLLEPMLGNKAARWEVPKFTWLGSLSRDVNSCVASGRSGIRSIRDAATRQIVVGTTGPSAMDMKAPVTLAKVLGYNLKFVSGYTGSDTAHMALETGEIDAYCAFWASLAMGKQKQNIEKGVFVPIVQFGSKPHPAFGDAPVVYDLAKNDDEMKILKFIFKATEFGRITLAPPGVPAARAKVLREAFWAAATSERLMKDAERRKMAIDPMTAEETEKTLLDLVDAPQAIIDRAIASMHR